MKKCFNQACIYYDRRTTHKCTTSVWKDNNLEKTICQIVLDLITDYETDRKNILHKIRELKSGFY